MRVNKIHIETQIRDLNLWLERNPGHELERLKKHRLQYLAMKAQEMEETQAETIEI